MIHIVNSMDFRDITGKQPPPTPISAKLYTDYGYPWFELLDEGKKSISKSKKLAKVKSIKAMDSAKGFSQQQDDSSVLIKDGQLIQLEA